MAAKKGLSGVGEEREHRLGGGAAGDGDAGESRVWTAAATEEAKNWRGGGGELGGVGETR